MNFFDGHAFSLYDSTPDHQGESRHVPVYYGVQYNHAGRFRFALNHGPVMEYEGAYPPRGLLRIRECSGRNAASQLPLLPRGTGREICGERAPADRA